LEVDLSFVLQVHQLERQLRFVFFTAVVNHIIVDQVFLKRNPLVGVLKPLDDFKQPQADKVSAKHADHLREAGL